MKFIRILFSVIVISMLTQSCGVITKSRYGNGLKLDIWNRTSQGFDSAKLAELRKRNHKESNDKKVTFLNDDSSVTMTNQSSKVEAQSIDSLLDGFAEIVEHEKIDTLKKGKKVEAKEPPLPYETDKNKSGETDAVEPFAIAAAAVLFVSVLLLFLFFPLGLVGIVASIVLGFFAIAKIQRKKEDGVKVAGLGIAISVVVIAFLMLMLLVALVLLLIAAL